MQTNFNEFPGFPGRICSNEILAIFRRIFTASIVSTLRIFERQFAASCQYFAVNFRANFHPFRQLLSSSFREKFAMIEIRETSFSSACMHGDSRNLFVNQLFHRTHLATPEQSLNFNLILPKSQKYHSCDIKPQVRYPASRDPFSQTKFVLFARITVAQYCT